jgi:uncharacterized protein
MKNLPKNLPVLFLAVAILLVGGNFKLTTTHAEGDDQPTQITVTGSAYIAVKPDVAYIQLGVDIPKEILSEALSEAAEKTIAIVAALKQAGIAEEDIQTTAFSVRREEYYPDSSSERRVRYHVINMLNVTVRKIDTVNQVYTIAFDAGANTTENIYFGLVDARPLTAKVRQTAFENAQTHAAELAKMMGGKLGKIISMSEYNSDPSPVNSLAAGFGFAGGAADAAASISAGAIQVRVEISITYRVN